MYITRIAGDGTERHFTSYNGVEAPSKYPIPVRAPPPGSALPSPHNKAPGFTTSVRPAASGNNSSPESQARQKQQQAEAQKAHPLRAEATVPLMSSPNYRAATPPHLSGRTPPSSSVKHPHGIQPDSTRRTTSPSPMRRTKSPPPPLRRAASPPPADPLRRQQTVPAYQPAIVSVGAPMPRPQSPHFYRTRSSSEALKPVPTPTKLKTSYKPSPTSSSGTSYGHQSAPQSHANSPVERDFPPTSYNPTPTKSKLGASGNSQQSLASDYYSSSSRRSNTQPAPEGVYMGHTPSKSKTMPSYTAVPQTPEEDIVLSGGVGSQRQRPLGHKHLGAQTAPPVALGPNQLGLGLAAPSTNEVPRSSSSRHRSHGHSESYSRSQPPTVNPPAAGLTRSSSRSRHTSSQSKDYANVLPTPPMMSVPAQCES